MFNDRYCLTDAVLQGRKTMTRREPYFGEISEPNAWFYAEGAKKGKLALCDGARVVHTSRYRINEVVSVAQDYQKAIDQCKSSIQGAKMLHWSTPIEAFAVLIDKVSGKGTWDKNPWVFAYTFELIN